MRSNEAVDADFGGLAKEAELLSALRALLESHSCPIDEYKKLASEQGFTLVELAIVLVIIGLIVGGVLVGQDLIKAAQIRSTVSDIERYNTSANAFRLKYNGIPGDLLANKAAGFGLVVRSGANGHGDGDGVLEGADSSDTIFGGAASDENIVFWRDLSDAGMIAESFTAATFTVTAIVAADMPDYFPALRLRENAYIHAYAEVDRMKNSYHIFGITDVDVDAFPTLEPVISPLEAYQIDSKSDNGIPTTGTIVALMNTEVIDTGNDTAAVSGACVVDPDTIDNNGDEVYAMDEALVSGIQEELNCMIRIRAHF